MRVAILGTGLIGGSLGMALRAAGHEVIAFDTNAEAAREAVSRGAADTAAENTSQACAGAEVVFIATPVSAIVPTLEQARENASGSLIFTDVGSTKARVVLEAEAVLRDRADISFIGGHPMAGSEKDGIAAARPDLFDDAWWVLTPTDHVDPAAYQTLHTLISSLGAKVMALEAQRHDELMAVVSHIPQLAATTLMNLAAEKGRDHGGLLALAAGGFRDVTRIAASNPDLWVEICKENHEAIVAELEELTDRLKTLEGWLRDGRFDALRDELTSASEARRALGRKEVSGELFEIVVEIPDRPGVLAEVTRLVGDLGINIEDLSISHAAEGGKGQLHLWTVGEEYAARIHNALSTHRYAATTIKA